MRPAFIFKEQAAAAQRRLFGGPLVPDRLIRPAFVPVVPDFPGFRFQALHAADAAAAYRLAVISGVRGAFNLAAEPVVDAELLADCLGARVVRVPSGAVRAAASAMWHLHVVPASPYLFDVVRQLPIMDSTRARAELGWTPQHTARDAINAFLAGLRGGSGMPTPPLAGRVPGGRPAEVAKGVGQRP
jgi:nucleoside-diphosphate-sugar epimerase